MRRKLSKLLLMITVVCMSVMTLVLAACSNTSTEPQKPAQDNTKVNTVTMLKDVISNLKASYALDKTFGIDVAAKYLQDDKNDDTMDVKFELNAKGNVDVNDDATENATNFVIELNKVGVESKETMFGIAYEVIDGKPYFFVNLLNGGYEKINGFSILSLYKMANAQVAGGAGGINIESLIAYVAPILFGDTGKVENGVYTFNFDLANLVNEIEGFIPLLTGALNMSTEDLDSLVAIFCKNMTFSSGEAVDSLADLVDYVNTEMSFSGTIAVEFNADKKFTSSSLTFDYANGDEGKTYTFSVDKAFVGITNTPIDTFNGFALTEDARKQNQAYNLLNFSLDGEAMAIGGEHDGAKYSINVESDLDPFVFFGLLESTSKENILACLNKMGYFHLQIDEVKENGEFDKNILTLHTKSEEGFAVLALDAYDAIIYKVGLGGVYDFEALVDVIGMLTAPKGATATAGGGINVGALLSQMLGYFHADDIANNGVTVELKNLVFGLVESLGMQLDSMLQLGVSAILGSEVMNVKLQTTTFGTCEQVETSSITANIRTDSEIKNNNDLIKEVTSLDGFSGNVFQGATNENLIDFFTGKVAFGKVFDITGINLKDEPVKTSGFIMNAKYLDFSKPGKQNVTLYIAIASDILDLAGAGLALDDMLPLSGVLKYETTINVVPYDSSRVVAFDKVKNGHIEIIENDNLISKVKDGGYRDVPSMKVDEYTFALESCNAIITNKEGKDVTSEVYVDGKIVKNGFYKVKFEKYGYVTPEITVGVAGLELKSGVDVDSVALGGEWTFSKYQVVTYNESGEKVVVADESVTVTYNKTPDKIFDTTDKNWNAPAEKYIVNKDFAIANTNFEITHKFTANNGTSLSIKKIIKLTSDTTLASQGALYFGNKVSSYFDVTIKGVEYKAQYDVQNKKWIVKSASGDVKDIEVTLEWEKAGSGNFVEIDENGYIVNYPNENKASIRSTSIYYTVRFGDYYKTGNFSAYELYASNKPSHKIANTLDGYISNVDKIYYEKDGQKVTLEFKYGKDGYAIYEKGTDVKVYDVTMKITKDSQEVQLVDGKFAELGTYKIEYDMTINGINQKFYHTVTVK